MMKVAVVVPLLVTAAALLSACSATDVGYAGAFKVVREWMTINGADPEAYDIRVEEDVCAHDGSGRCYYITAWPKGRPPQGSKGDCWLTFWVDPVTGQLEGPMIVD